MNGSCHWDSGREHARSRMHYDIVQMHYDIVQMHYDVDKKRM